MAMASGGAAKPRSMWWQAGPFEQWVQEVLISVLVPEGASVCELMCGSGKALGKWQRAKLTQYVGIGEGRHRTLLPLWPCRAPPCFVLPLLGPSLLGPSLLSQGASLVYTNTNIII